MLLIPVLFHEHDLDDVIVIGRLGRSEFYVIRLYISEV
jgi:hypothetical protein